MNVKDKASVLHQIDRKWVREEKRTFTEYPGIPGTDFVGGQETWMQLAQFYVEDLRWLLSLEHHKFWSHMLYSEKAHELLVAFLKESPTNYMKNNLLVQEDMKNIFKEMEHLVFLLFLRLSTEKESEKCYIKNLGEIIYNNYLFTVPIILDICLIYGTSNSDLVKKMISDIITLAPNFLDDFQVIIPYFVCVLKMARKKFSVQHQLQLKEKADERTKGSHHMVCYLYDSVATIQRLFELYPSVCRFFSKGELITELVSFYSNVLPQIEKCWASSGQHTEDRSLICDLIENIRIDILKIVKSVFDFILTETDEILGKTEMVDEYLTLMTEILSESVFFSDYNLIYSVEFEIECAVRNCQNVDTVKLNHVLREVASVVSNDVNNAKESCKPEKPGVKLKSLIAEVKGIFPDMEECFIEQCLKYYDNSAERVITAILENAVPSSITQSEKRAETSEGEEVTEYKGKHKNKHQNLSEMLDDKEEINMLKEKYAQLYFVEDEAYDDEYDDTYDESIDVSVKEGDEVDRRGFVVPRVLRKLREKEEEEDEDEAEEEDEDEDEEEHGSCRRNDYFVEDPAAVRQRQEHARNAGNRRDVAGRGRGQGQSRQVIRNRGFKESHKSFIANHNRKKQASRKMSRGMIPS